MGIFNLFFRKPAPSEGRLSALDREKAQEHWHWVDDQLKLGRPNSLKLAIIEADKIVDESLKIIYPGRQDLAERLKLAQEKFVNRQVYEDLWYAHKIRNMIVHETSYDLPTFEAKNVIEKYRQALTELGML
jgi:hypothetical protein